MQTIIDFLISALPWVAIGQFVAVYVTRESARKQGTLDQLPTWFKAAEYFPSFYLFLVALMNYADGSTTDAVVFLVLAVLFVLFPIAGEHKK